jgi:hypothetical protein
MDLESLIQDARQYKGIKEQEKLLAERKKSIRDRLVAALEIEGYEDENGHIKLDLTPDLRIVHQRKESKSINVEAAEKLLKEKGIYEDCVEMVPVIKEDAIMSAYYKEQLTEAEIDSLVEVKVVYAFLL